MIFKNIFFQIFLVLSNLFKENFSQLLIIPLESSLTINNNVKNYPISFIDTIFSSTLSTNIKIGTPESEIRTFITPSLFYFGIIPNYYINNSTIDQNYIINKSETFKNISKTNKTHIYGYNEILAQEKFKFKTYNYTLKKYNEISLDEVYFILGVKNEFNDSEIYNLFIGLKPDYIYDEIVTSLVHQIKKKNITNNYYFSFLYYYSSGNKNLYNNSFLINTKCDLVIGEVLHKFKPDLFYESQLIKINTLKDDFYKTNWMIKFTKIFFYSKNNITNNITFTQNTKAYLNFDEYLIKGTYEYYENIKKDFFDDYKNNCFTNISDKYLVYYCEKSDNFTIENLKNFPKIYFQHIELNYTFELDYEDLFIEKDGKFWFLVVFGNNFKLNQWFFGNVFLRKYNFTFDIENKLIGFYNPNLPKIDNDQNEDEKNKKNYNNNEINYWMIICLVCCIVLIIVLIFVWKKFLKKENKKKRANELDDDYEYKVNDGIKEPIINN